MSAIRSEKFELCQQAIQYRFQNLQFLETALTHTSCAATPSDSNERMEFLGDSVLGMVITEDLYRQFPKLQEGALSIIRGNIVSRKSCARIARSLELGDALFLGKGITVIPSSILANALESVIAAVYLDGGIEPAKKLIRRLFREIFESAAVSPDGNNYKAELQALTQRQSDHLNPVYHLLDEQGPEHRKCFKIQAQIGTRFFQAAWGNTKKDAEQRAAENAMAELGGSQPPWPDGE